MLAPQPLAGRQLGALEGDLGRLLEPAEGLQQAREAGEGAGDLVDPADRLGDPAGLAELLDPGVEVAEEGQVTPRARRASPSEARAPIWPAIAIASSHSSRDAR